MKNAAQTSNLYKWWIILFVSLVTLQSCTTDNGMPEIDPKPDTPIADGTNNDTNNDSNTDVSNVDTSNSNLPEIDKTFLAQVKNAASEYDKNVIWNGYNFSSQPMYYIYVDAENSPVRGYVVNAAKQYEGASKIEGDNALGLNLYRYDKDIVKATNLIQGSEGNGSFDFYYEIEGQNHYVQLYSDESAADIINPAVTLAVHEVFHIYQFSDWITTPNIIQEENNYPITKDLLALQILSVYIATKMPAETNKENVLEYLKMYVAIRSKEMELDISPQKFVRNMANEQEKGEGTAKYIDNIIGSKLVSGFEAVFGSPEFFKEITSSSDVRSQFAFGIWYDTGAAAVHMLKNQNIKIEQRLKDGETLFDIAEKEMNLSESQKTAMLQKAKDEFNWTGIQELAEKLANL